MNIMKQISSLMLMGYARWRADGAIADTILHNCQLLATIFCCVCNGVIVKQIRCVVCCLEILDLAHCLRLGMEFTATRCNQLPVPL